MGWEAGERLKRKGIYVYQWLIHVDVWQRPTQYCKTIILQMKTSSGRLQSIRSHRVRNNWSDLTHTARCMYQKKRQITKVLIKKEKILIKKKQSRLLSIYILLLEKVEIGLKPISLEKQYISRWDIVSVPSKAIEFIALLKTDLFEWVKLCLWLLSSYLLSLSVKVCRVMCKLVPPIENTGYVQIKKRSK